MLDILDGYAVTVHMNIHTGSYSLYKINYGFQKIWAYAYLDLVFIF